MKKSNLLVVIFFIVMTIISISVCSAQSYSLAANGTIVTKPKAATTAKVADKVYATQNGITFYVGSKGGVYYLKTSKKTGKQYKCYVK